MNLISLFNNNNKTYLKIQNQAAMTPFFGLKLKPQLNKDVVSFTGVQNQNKETLEKYKKIAEQVNQSLEDEDDPTAFETLGYDISTDFETDEITIHGSYKPYFEEAPSERNGKPLEISYKSLGINEEKLLQNVRIIQGARYVASDFKPDTDYVIDKKSIYPEPVAKILDEILIQRTQEAQKALLQDDSEKALNILGYKTTKDENGNITIEGDYSNALVTYERREERNPRRLELKLENYGIDENILLKDVTAIKGRAKFGANYVPNHYIEMNGLDLSNFTYDEGEKICKYFANNSPAFILTLQEVQQKLEQDDNFSALQTLGYDVSKNENDEITINGNYQSRIQVKVGDHKVYKKYSDCAIDEAKLLNNVIKITGDMDIYDSKLDKLDKRLTVAGITSAKEEQLGDFLSSTDVESTYNIPQACIKAFARENLLVPSVKTYDEIYFGEIEGENKEFLDDILQRRDEILSFDDLHERYDLTRVLVRNAMYQTKILTPYKLDISKRTYDAESCMFDVSDKKNLAAIDELTEKRARSQRVSKLKRENIANYGATIKQNCRKNNTVNTFPYDLKAFPCEVLQKLGYGSKADLMANVGIRTDAYSVKQYLLRNDKYDVTNIVIKDILQSARDNNPALIKVSILKNFMQKLGIDLSAIIAQGNLNIITQAPHELMDYSNFVVDLSDEKNFKYLSTQIDNDEFRFWLNERMKSYQTYTRENNVKLESFKTEPEPSKTEEEKKAAAEYRELEVQRKNDAERKRIEKVRNNSLRTTIAWALSPETIKVKRRNADESIKAIIEKRKELKEISEQLLSGEITPEEAELKIKALKLDKKDEIALLNYHKRCWEISGTEEYSNALSQAKKYLDLYNKFGISAIKDSDIRKCIINWENNKGHKYQF